MSMLVTMGSALLVERAKEVSIRVKNVYSLDFDKVKTLYERVSQESEDFSIPFKKPLEDPYLQDRYVEAVSRTQIHQMYRIISFRIEGQFDCFRDMNTRGDPFRLKEIVDLTMGITPSDLSVEERIKYFNLMKETGFLKTHHRELSSVIYHPGLAAKKMLRSDPKIQTLILGCGRNVNYVPYCGFEQHKNALFVDRSSHIDPDVITDMHNGQFWQEIPTASLHSVLDHTNGYYVFEDPNASNTIKSIYRVLKWGGYFTLAQPFNSENKETTLLRRQMLEEAEFTVESEDQTTFRK